MKKIKFIFSTWRYQKMQLSKGSLNFLKIHIFIIFRVHKSIPSQQISWYTPSDLKTPQELCGKRHSFIRIRSLDPTNNKICSFGYSLKLEVDKWPSRRLSVSKASCTCKQCFLVTLAAEHRIADSCFPTLMMPPCILVFEAFFELKEFSNCLTLIL